MNKHYEINIFTASNQAYADPIIKELDPKGKLISKRYYNSDCDKISGIFIKDLSKLGRNLKDVIIVDNTVLCFALQLANGIPILSFYGDTSKKDTELKDLKHFLLYLKDKKDVKKEINSYFKWNEFDKFKDANRLVHHIFE